MAIEKVELAVTAEVAAARCGCSKGELLRMAHAGIIPSLRIGLRGRGVRFIVSDVIAALTSRSMKKGQAA